MERRAGADAPWDELDATISRSVEDTKALLERLAADALDRVDGRLAHVEDAGEDRRLNWHPPS